MGSLEEADAHIPYVAVDRDEWCESMKTYRHQLTNDFLLGVDDLVIEHVLNRGSRLRLIASSYRQGVMAANILSVAGYENVIVEVGRCPGSTVRSALMWENCDCTAGDSGSHACQWTNPTRRQLGGLLH
jgi:hypothetical protein